MEASSKDIFSSDRSFINFFSTVLMAVGAIAVLLSLSCIVFNWGYCRYELISLFGRRTYFKSDMLSVVMPLSLLIIGGSLRLYTRLAWLNCLLILFFMGLFFGMIGQFMFEELQSDYQRISQNGESIFSSPYWESFVINSSFVGMSVGSFIYLLLPQVRSLYWNRKEYVSSNS
ncbi:MAG: hypothetical protein AAF655_10010 [Bacteroidota bacterium]